MKQALPNAYRFLLIVLVGSVLIGISFLSFNILDNISGRHFYDEIADARYFALSVCVSLAGMPGILVIIYLCFIALYGVYNLLWVTLPKILEGIVDQEKPKRFLLPDGDGDTEDVGEDFIGESVYKSLNQ